MFMFFVYTYTNNQRRRENSSSTRKITTTPTESRTGGFFIAIVREDSRTHRKKPEQQKTIKQLQSPTAHGPSENGKTHNGDVAASINEGFLRPLVERKILSDDDSSRPAAHTHRQARPATGLFFSSGNANCLFSDCPTDHDDSTLHMTLPGC